jgi:YD repeat-containing protein
MTPTLTSFTDAQGKKHEFEFSVLEDKMIPTLMVREPGEKEGIEGDKEYFEWNPDDGLATIHRRYWGGTQHVEGWKYTTLPPEREGQTPAFSRMREDGTDQEFCQEDPGRGIKVRRSMSGPLITTYRFVGGPALGRIRKVVEKRADGREIVTQEIAYDGKGRVIRDTRDGKTTTIKYNDAERTSEAFDNNKNRLWKKFYDDQERILRVEHASGKKMEFEYLPDGTVKARAEENGKIVVANFRDGRLVDKESDPGPAKK